MSLRAPAPLLMISATHSCRSGRLRNPFQRQWASVYETQQVLRGEDKRFRQSRMPVVKIVPVYDENGHGKPYSTSERLILQFMFRNEGDGPAIQLQWYMDCRITALERIVGRGANGPSVEIDHGSPLTRR